MSELRAWQVSRKRRLACKAGIAFLTITAVGFAAPVGAADTHTIAMDGTRFIPETLTVKRGDRIVWVNKDPFPHTATAAGIFDSGSIAADKSWSYVAQKSGRFAYVCTLHPGMKGTLIVQ